MRIDFRGFAFVGIFFVLIGALIVYEMYFQ